MTAGLLAVCIVGTQYFVIEGNKFGKPEGLTRKEEGSFYFCFSFLLIMVLTAYASVQFLSS